ncbi:MAG TPA: DUF934 domain-containing protein [Methylotenera sp.]|nr:DUF934 domain-containing protein [Methylotenera sp.]HPH06379.1 DUF934 domain-containing protein [Methylotenera sp.]HPN00802.1 DUF934 domain-containing protein [Methylotenera sp.]
MSHLIKLNSGQANLENDEWTLVQLPASQTEERKQAGKVVLFKLTGEDTVSNEQIANTVIPASGKIIVPLSVFIARNSELTDRVEQGQIGVWLATHEPLETLTQFQTDLNKLPVIAVFVERFADGRIFSLGNLLRTRFGFKNELRAFGDVLRDQLFFLKRCGFTSYVIRADRSAQDAISSLNDFSQPYQGAVDESRPAFKRYHRGV